MNDYIVLDPECVRSVLHVNKGTEGFSSEVQFKANSLTPAILQFSIDHHVMLLAVHASTETSIMIYI